MPRILPRLLKRLAASAHLQETYNIPPGLVARKSRKSLCKRVPHFTSVHPNDRSQSVLLDMVNPIINAKDFVRHKSLPPQPVLPNTKVSEREVYDPQRVMTEQELAWWSSPYLRMLSSRLRQCIVTSRYLPSDFLIRVAPMSLPTPRMSRTAQSLLPDGLQHHKFKQRKSGFGHYFICWKEAVENFPQRKLPRRSAPHTSIHPLLSRQIGHLLRVRVLQELEILARRAKKRVKTPHSSLIRRLTRDEWKEFKSSGIISHPSAIALIVVPPLNKHPVTKQRPVPNASASPEAPTTDPLILTTRSLPPLSTLHPTSNISIHDNAPFPDDVSKPSVPMYNGIALFPARSQRAALHERLCRVLRVETFSRSLQRNLPRYGSKAQGDGKGSHAFLLCSDATTVGRADTVPLAIALWRVKMWEGGGWEEGPGRWDL